MERPNTVHGLIAKLRYLVAIDCDPADIAAIDRVLALFGFVSLRDFEDDDHAHYSS